MTTFQQYASYYDLLYSDKDYCGEAAFVADLISRHVPAATSILELGCGTGIHALALTRRGYAVAGVDLSHEMVAQARKRLSRATLSARMCASFNQGDIRTVRLTETFDAVISLFHVMSYQITDSDVLATLTTAEQHMKPSGIVVFDYWYAPAVRSDPPTARVKCVEDDVVRITRVARPMMHSNDNVVDVNYDITIENKITGNSQRVCEHHRMRYFSTDELERSLRTIGLKLIASGEWPTAKPAGMSNWSAYLVAARSKGFGHFQPTRAR